MPILALEDTASLTAWTLLQTGGKLRHVLCMWHEHTVQNNRMPGGLTLGFDV